MAPQKGYTGRPADQPGAGVTTKLRNPTCSRSLRVEPSIGEYSDIGVDLVYVIRFRVHNTSTTVQRVRFKPPENNAFKLVTHPQSIAPGLHQDIELEFCTKDHKDYSDSFSVVTDEGALEVPLHAWFPRPSLLFADEIDLGVMPVQHNASRTLTITNAGKSPGQFTFKSEGMASGLAVAPSSGTVLPGKPKEVQVNYFASEVGVFVSVVQVVLKDQSTRQLKVTARVVDSKVDLTTIDNVPLTSAGLDFGTVFYGQKKCVEVLVVNNSPFSTSFTIHPPEQGEEAGEDASRPGTPPPPPIESSPADGRVQKSQSQVVKFWFQPLLREGKTGFQSELRKPEPQTWRQTFGVEIAETEQKMDLVIAGRAVHTDVELSQYKFNFPDTLVNDHLDMIVTATNSSELPVDVVFSKVAQFHIRPSTGRAAASYRLPAQGDMNFVISFCPNQLGKFKRTIDVSLCGGIKVIPLSVQGSASKVGVKQAVKAGTQRTGDDFRKDLKFFGDQQPPSTAPDGAGYATGSGSQTAADKEKKQYAWMTDASDELAMLQLNDLEQRKYHTKLYNDYITQSRLSREHAARFAREIAQEKREAAAMGDRYMDKTLVDIGMVPAEGLVPPEPVVPKRHGTSIWKGEAERSTGEAGDARMMTKAMKFDEHRPIKKKFKEEPAGLNERRECRLVLSPKDLAHVAYGPRLLDFGKVSVFSTNTKSFCVHNTLQSHILVKIPVALRDELKNSFPASQVIPPGQVAGFDIVFRSDTEQTFTQAMWFQLNENHKLKFLLHAEAVPIEVSLSQEKMDFRFNDFVLDPTLTQNLTLTNHGNAEASFKWAVEDKETAFSFNPDSGTIPPNGQRNVDITFTPQQSNESRCLAQLVIEGGNTRKLQLTGFVQEARCVFNTQKVDFGTVAVGSAVQKSVSIKSLGPSTTVYSLASLPQGLTVNNMRNRLTVGQSQEIVMTLRPTQAALIQGVVTCHVRGMKQPLRLNVKADPKIPRVELNAPSSLNFGKVIVGTREFREIELVNVGSIPATLMLDLIDLPDFLLCHDTQDPVESAAPPDEEEGSMAGGYMMIHRDINEEEDDDDEFDGDDVSEEAVVQRRGCKYKIVVNERSTLKCCLRFAPTSVTQKPHTFPLMMSLAGIPVVEASQELMQQVTAEALKPRLVLSHTAVEFGSRVVVKEGTSKITNSISLRLTNEVESELQWNLVAPQDPATDEIFRITPTSGSLAPGHTASVSVNFFPAEVRSYSMKVGVCLDGNRSRNYMDILVTGNGANPALTFDRRELLMPIVPLDVPSRAAFTINNEGYESLDLRWRLPGAQKWKEEGPLPITLSFPDGHLLGQHHSQVTVEVTCLAKKPISFTAAIDFTDDEDMIFSIPVSFISDNCLLTAYPYLATHKPTEQGGCYTLAADTEKRPVMIKVTEDQDTLMNPATPRNGGGGQRSEARSYAGSGYDTDQTNTYKTVDKWNRKSYTKKNADRLRMWLNANVLQDPVDDLIAGFTVNHGKALIDLVEHLAGRPPPGALRVDKMQNINRRDITAAEFKQYDDCLTFLKGWGAMLVDVRPEYLLTYEGFQRITNPQKGWGGGCGASAPTTQNRSGERGKARLSERKFNHRQTQSIMGLIFQIIKVFVLSKVTWKGFRTMPQSFIMQQRAAEEKWSNATTDSSVMGSNLYSTAEAILLKWLTIHVQHYFPNSLRVMSFDELRDCRAFAAVLCAYIPTLETRLGLTSGAGSGFIAQPTSVTDCEKNASIVIESLKAYGMDLKVTAKELVESSVRDLLLITVNLFQQLPQFIPQATISFSGRLQETITKTVELQNPHRWPIDYLVLLDDDSGEFQIDKGDNKLRLEAKAAASLPIWIVPRFSKKCAARLTFLSMGRLGPNSASTIVFNVETNIDSQHALKTLNIESPLYEVTTHDIEFDNPFNERGSFTVQYHQQYVKDVDAKGKPISYGEEANSGSYQDAFWTAQDVVNVKKGEKATITFQFIPFMRGKYTCRVVLVDEKVGEVIYLINATVLPPLPFEKMAFQTELSATTAKEVSLPLKNVAQDKAMQILHHERFKGFKAKMKADTTKTGEAQSRYRVEYSSPFFTGPKEISMEAKEEGEQAQVKKKGVRGSPLSLNVMFQPKGPGVYPGKITLISDGDVRVIEVEGKSRSPGMKADLNFECAARQHVQQELPVTNTTGKDWTIHATITGEYFMGPREIVVKAGKVKNYTLSFSPQWVCDIKGSLVLKNVDSLEKFTYNLMAKVVEPLAESTILAECVARDTTTVSIKVPNITNDDVVYNVETDIPYARGSSQLTVPKQEVGRYSLILKPILSGKSTGSITFTTPGEQYVWYVVQLQVARPPPERTIEVRAVARNAVAAEITIGNPTESELSFIVRRKGEGLFGENRVIVAGKGTSVYQLIYNPLRAGTGEGQLSFYHDDIGEHWYEVKMVADEAPPEELPEVHCELGKATTIELAIENPVDHDLPLAVSVSNTQNFSVSPAGNLVLKPHQVARPVVTYMPSSIAQRQEAVVTFSHAKLGKWEYVIRGKGSPPTLMEATVVHAIAGRSQQTSVVFRNPFPLPRRFLVTLRSPGGDGEGPFALMLKRKTNTVSPFTSLTVPISYSPQTISEHRAAVEVQVVGDGVTDSDLRWEYPVVGVAEALPMDNVFKFSSKCRSEFVQTLSLPLYQADLDLSTEKFTHEVVFPENHPHINALRSAVVVQAAYDEPRVQGDTVKVEYIVTFTPLRTFTAAVELLIRKKTGGLWRFELRFEALPPPPDDTILLEAAMAQRSSVGFNLLNIFPEEQAYRAYFTSDSAAEFTVSPAKGVLAPLHPTHQHPTKFVISFASSQYGKTLAGTLVIEGELVEWRYEVRGTLPRYRAPQVAASKIENKLSKDAQDASRQAATRKVDWVKQNQGAYTGSPSVKPLSSARARQGMLSNR
eukprot:TRINITY_DN2869_c0_g2_i1.p1 TRINITY_DN2869_c0_g2~~TRINITY_DN2869_c0_g2_i1.p1  ORF type:complete len:2912 (+),score=1278.25 TRINITY_DN2869_c0_g2_i1:97-8832(+)